MTTDASGGAPGSGTLRAADGKGIVRMDDRFDASVEDVWAALTDPRRLALWLGEVEGDLRLGGEFRARFFASGWEGTGRIDSCEPPRHLLVWTKDEEQPDETPIEVTLTDDGDQTTLVWEERGMPLNLIAAYGAGIQIRCRGSRGPRCRTCASRPGAALRGALARLSGIGTNPRLDGASVEKPLCVRDIHRFG